MNSLRSVAAACAVALASLVLAQAGIGGGIGPRPPRPPGPPAIAPATARVARTPDLQVAGAFLPAAGSAAGLALDMNLAALRGATDEGGPFVIRRFPLAPARFVDLVVERFRVTTPQSRFVIGVRRGPDEPSGFDPETVLLLRGRVIGYPRSTVYLGLAQEMSRGSIDLGAGYGEFAVSSQRGGGGTHLPGQVGVYAVRGDGPTGVCQMDPEEGPTPDPTIPPPTDEVRRGLRQVELAVDTDLEFFQLFGNVNATSTYLVELYGAVSDVFMREINSRVDLVYSRVWTTPQPFQADLNAFAGYWSSQMQSTHRDVAQMFSGRPDKPGGVAYLPGLCNGSAYSFCGNAQAYFEDPFGTGQWRYDVHVTAHELGHNLGTNHTDVYGLDNCGLLSATPQRGTIMSYCNQTVSGGQPVIDMAFHKRTRQAMLEVMVPLTVPSCLVFDCNQNGLSDAIDIAGGVSLDTNSNGIPDECEDCNGNSVLDPQDISAGTSLDLNTNGVPDECEPDCNNNNVPDDRDISLGTSQDAHGDGVPDECDADLNHNGQSDYNELCANMPLDRNRNRTLDAVEDCDGDTIPDLIELDTTHDAWVGSTSQNTLRRFHAVTGVLMQTSATGVSQVADVMVTVDRRVLATSSATDRVVEYDHLGAFVRDLVPAGLGGLDQPGCMLLSPSSTLLVASEANNRVLEYNLASGLFIRTLVAAGAGGLVGPFGLARGPDGLLYVSTSDNRVLRYNMSTGAFVSQFVAPGSGNLSGPRALMFLPSGKLLIASLSNNRVLAYNGTTGAFLENWAKTTVAFTRPWGLRMARDGNVLVSANGITETHVTRARIQEFDIDNGYWVRGFVLGNDTGLNAASGFDLVPDAGTDCNENQRPDNCDISSGFSADLNSNGVPDECEQVCYPDCNGDDVLNLSDFGCFQTKFGLGQTYADCNGDGIRNLSDFGCFTTKFALGCP